MITSARHPLVQTFRRVAQRPDRSADPHMLLDGPRLIAEALDAGVEVDVALVAEGHDRPDVAALVARLSAAGATVRAAAPRVVKTASSVVTPQGIVAIARRPPSPDLGILDDEHLVLLVADGVQDPGNVGTMIRTAVAAGATAVAITPSTADPFLPKVLRATMGAAFRIPIFRIDAQVLRDRLTARGTMIVIADPRGLVDCTEAPLNPPVALVIGNEAGGPSPAWISAGTAVRIPLYGPVESLNAGVASALLLYEVARRMAH